MICTAFLEYCRRERLKEALIYQSLFWTVSFSSYLTLRRNQAWGKWRIDSWFTDLFFFTCHLHSLIASVLDFCDMSCSGFLCLPQPWSLPGEFLGTRMVSMLESTVQWKKENLRSGLVQMYSVTYILTQKCLLRSRKKNMSCLQSTILALLVITFSLFLSLVVQQDEIALLMIIFILFTCLPLNVLIL